MSQYEILALVPGDHAGTPHPQVDMVAHDGVTAVFSRKKRKLMLLPESRKARLSDAAARQALLEQIMPLGTVIPVGPGAYLTHREAATLIKVNREQIDGLANRFKGKHQYQISVEWQADQVLSHFRYAPELKHLFDDGKVQANHLTNAVGRLAHRLGENMVNLITPIAKEMIQLPTAETMLFNIVVLIEDTATADLDRAVEQIDAIWTEGLKIKQIGPAPAASFARLEPFLITDDAILKARAVFGFDAPHDVAAIRQARRSMLLIRPQDVDDIRHASNILMADFSNDGAGPFHLCSCLSEDQSTIPAVVRDVA